MRLFDVDDEENELKTMLEEEEEEEGEEIELFEESAPGPEDFSDFYEADDDDGEAVYEIPQED